MAELAIPAAVAAVGYVLSKPEIKIWLPGLPPLEFDNPLFRTREGQRLGSLQIQETAEGAPDNRCFGPQNRVAGSLVWMSDLREVKKKESGGGKGGAGGEFITYQYFAHLMVRLCRAKTPVSRIPKIYADGKLLFNLDTDVNYSSNGIDTQVRNSIIYVGSTTSSTPTLASRNELLLESDVSVSPRPDLSKLKSGNSVSISGYTGGTLATNLELVATPTTGATTVQLRAITSSVVLQADDVLEFSEFAGSYSVQTGVTVTTAAGGVSVTIRNTVEAEKPIGTASFPLATTMKRGAQANNGTFMVLASAIDPAPGPPKVSRARLADARNSWRKFSAVSIGGATVVIAQSQPTFKSSQVGRVDILHGGPDQTPPAILQQFEGNNVSQVYGMRNRAGFALTDLNMTDFGNRIPNLEGHVEQSAEPGLVADVIRTILVEDAGWPESGLDVSQVTGSFLGFAFRSPQPPNRSLQSLQLAFDVVRWEQNGKVYFANRGALQSLAIPVSHIGAYEDEQSTRSLGVSDPPTDQLPSEVIVSYRSSTNDLQLATKRSKRTQDVPTDIRTISLGDLVISDDLAQQIADRLLSVAWGAQRKLKLSLSQAYVGRVRPGMILTFGPIYGQDWQAYVERVDRGANMMMLVQAQEYDPTLLVQDATTEGTLGLSASGNTQDGGHTMPAPTNLLLLDIPPLSDQFRSEPGITIAPSSEDTSRPWRGGVLYWSRDAGASWNRAAELVDEAVSGELISPPSTTVLPFLWDRTNTIRIRVRHTQVQPGSVSEEACLLGANRWLIGREIIGASSVVFVERDPVDGSRTYDLSVLLRGQHSTDQSMDEHASGEAVVWLDGPGVTFLPLSYSHVDVDRLWKLVPNGGTIEDAPALRLTPCARNCRPFHVRDVVSSRDGSGNLTVTSFQRGVRISGSFLELGDPLDEETEAYEVDVIVSGEVVRTISVGPERSFEYSIADQTADGAPSPCEFRFYQLSAALLRGQESSYLL